MASRPFATINVALETEEEPPDLIGGNVKVSRTPESSQFPELTGGLLHRGGVSTMVTPSTIWLTPPLVRFHQTFV